MNEEYKVINWWWVRHAPVLKSDSKVLFYGNLDVNCTQQIETAKWLAKNLPEKAYLITSTLKRTVETATCVIENGLNNKIQDSFNEFNEQSFGDWQGKKEVTDYDQINKTFWTNPAYLSAPNGESFADLFARTSKKIVEINDANPHTDIISFSHGGTIRAAIAFALNISLKDALNFKIDNLSVTKLTFHQNKNNLKDHVWSCSFINKTET